MSTTTTQKKEDAKAPALNLNPSKLKQDVLKALEGAPLSKIQQAKLDEVLANYGGGPRNPYQENPHTDAAHVLPAVLSPIVKETTGEDAKGKMEPILAASSSPNPVTAGKIPEISPAVTKETGQTGVGSASSKNLQPTHPVKK